VWGFGQTPVHSDSKKSLRKRDSGKTGNQARKKRFQYSLVEDGAEKMRVAGREGKIKNRTQLGRKGK